ncbi:plasmid mobilization relaxosome protein MobC [Butyrivibrio sp.]|uniref:plasmid mobilization protein n=1 Tax=Butyrivibrio sp. TaxID=28121 RepID=UPI0025C24C79|nr:plasmid mobilization relaxosome protein MobC [Butyrivibrio sp.]MBQ9301653.1 plasmid mobilization relaxosome protein MobC [Butyrivibrio sp.]
MAVSYGEKILIKLTPDDLEAIKAKMEQAGVRNRSAYIRKMAIDGYIILLDLSDIKEVVRLLRINSNNINQIAKKANQTGNIYIDDIKSVQAQQEEIWEAVKVVMERLATIK